MTWSEALPALVALVIGYLLGSIPWGLILTRVAGLGDVRRIGSGNIGATNVLRTGRKDLAAYTLIFDVVKGTAAVYAGAAFGPGGAMLGGLGAFLGHLFPVWLGFRGGKGVATCIGVLIGLWWPATAVFLAVWLATAFLSRYSSLSALAASLAALVAILVFRRDFALLTAALVILLWLKHLPNIRRLLSGEESRIGGKAA
jgi:glycerol-3-phosphate acyltransferase PlsY